VVCHLPRDDAARTRFHPVTGKALGHAINRAYGIPKWDAARRRRGLLTPEMRHALDDKVAEDGRTLPPPSIADAVEVRPGIAESILRHQSRVRIGDLR
jgi:hypothetical protein